MLPSEFKAIKALVEMLRSKLSAIHKAIDDQSEAHRKANEACETQWSKVPGVIASAIRPTQDEIADTQTRYHQTYCQQERAIRVQRRLVIATWCAFGAAAAYGLLAWFQWRTMNKTYVEIRQQTDASQQAAYVACINAKIARASLIGAQESSADTREIANATIVEAQALAQSESAVMEPVAGNLDQLAIGNPVTIPFGIRNIGKGNARGVTAKARMIVVSRNGDFDFLYPAPPKTQMLTGQIIEAGKSSMDSFPGSKNAVVLRHGEDGHLWLTDQQMISDFESNKIDFILYGIITYRDTFGSHWTQFCFTAENYHPGAMPNQGHQKCYDYNKEDEPFTKQVAPAPATSNPPDIPCEPPKQRR